MEYQTELTNLELGRLYDSLPAHLKKYLDAAIRYGSLKNSNDPVSSGRA